MLLRFWGGSTPGGARPTLSSIPSRRLPLARCVSIIWDIYDTFGAKRSASDGPEVRALALDSGGCANAAPAAMPLPTEARDGCSGLVGDACARQLLMASSTMDDHLAVHDDDAVCKVAEH